MRIFIPRVGVVVPMDVSKAYEELKRLLRENKCRIVEEEPPSKIIVEHGSVFGFSPTSIEKVVTFYLEPVDSKTRIIAGTSLTSDAKLVSILEVVLNIVFLVIIGLFVSLEQALVELVMRVVERFQSYFPPYVMTELRLQVDKMNTMFTILIFIAVIGIVIGVIWSIYAYWKRDSFAENILKLLSLLP
jgi:hypothetical protein